MRWLNYIHILANVFVFSFAEIIDTESGYVESNLNWISRNGTTFSAFLGIPYAAAPVGRLRFQVSKNISFCRV